jgi:hypothetical protein
MEDLSYLRLNQQTKRGAKQHLKNKDELVFQFNSKWFGNDGKKCYFKDERYSEVVDNGVKPVLLTEYDDLEFMGVGIYEDITLK